MFIGLHVHITFTFLKGSVALINAVSAWVNVEMFCIKNIN